MLTAQQIHSAQFYGNLMGKDMPNRQSTRLVSIFGVLRFFSDAELTMNAKISARNLAIEKRVGKAVHAEWEGVFIEAYCAAYRGFVAEYNAKEERRLASLANLAKIAR